MIKVHLIGYLVSRQLDQLEDGGGRPDCRRRRGCFVNHLNCFAALTVFTPVTMDLLETLHRSSLPIGMSLWATWTTATSTPFRSPTCVIRDPCLVRFGRGPNLASLEELAMINNSPISCFNKEQLVPNYMHRVQWKKRLRICALENLSP